MPVSTGSPTLDSILDGGLPEQRTVLVSGTPGTGKSTLAMGFLQAGVKEGDECIYISTEQTSDELRDSFAPFDFDLDADNLRVTSLHPRPGQGTDQYESGDVTRRYRSDRGGDGGGSGSGYVLRTLEGDADIDDREIDFTPENLRQYLQNNTNCDRVVIDSVSGLQAIATREGQYRRVVLDLIQTFNSDIGATALFTTESSGTHARAEGAEQLGTDDLVQYHVHGVIRLWRQRVKGSYQRYLDVMKMRGVNHDTRSFMIAFADDGLRVFPKRRSHGEMFVVGGKLPTGMPSLDSLLDGGLIKGGGVTLEHDGNAGIELFLYTGLSSTLDEMMSLVLVPRVDTPDEFPQAVLDRFGVSLSSLLDNNQLFILDPFGSRPPHENIYDLSDEDTDPRAAVKDINTKARGKGIMYAKHTDAMVQSLGEDNARAFRYWLQTNQVSGNDIIFDIHNPNLMSDEVGSFYLDSSAQIIDTWVENDGIQYLQLKKSPSGDVGSVRVVEYINEPPFARLVS
ncbi:MAG: ATPase domain-containing protein [Natronomonas sp.]